MQQDIARHLLFSAHQQQQQAGLTAQLHALRLKCLLQAEQIQLPQPNQQLLSALNEECARLLLSAGASQQAADSRAARCAAATAAVAQTDGLSPQLPRGVNLADALLSDVAGQGLLDQASKAQQLLAQASAVLQRKVAEKAASATAPLNSTQQQRSRTEAASAQVEVRPKRKSITVPTAQERKRQLDGAPKGASQHQQPDAAARWGNAGGPTSAPKRQEGGHGSQYGAAGAAAPWGQPQGAAGAADDPIEVDDGDGGPSHRHQPPPAGGRAAAASSRWSVPPPMQPGRRQPQQQPAGRQQHGGGHPPDGEDESAAAAAAAAAGGAVRPGFKSARAQLVTDLRKKGQHHQANMFAHQAPRAGLQRPRGGGGGGPSRSGFVPPFVDKAIEHQAGGGGGGGHGGAAGGGQHGAGGEEGPLSAKTLQMLGVGEDGELPAELTKHDPRLVEAVCNDVIESGGVSWDDIAGLETAKELIKEIVVWPMLNPELFTGPRAPPKGILLFGPPGTGKTLIGRAVASNINASFFSISASTLTSKWIGEGEKMVKVLFAVAGVMQPSVIFIDEIDSIMSARKADGEHESSRRLKTELLVQMEGCDPASSERRVLLVGATNRPEELDEAARRRLPKQLYIPLPCAEARRDMITRQMDKVKAALSPADLEKVVAKTDGYSGSDMRHLIQEACQGPVRCAAAKLKEGIAKLNPDDLRPVVVKDFQHAAKAQRASVTPADILRYEEYNERHGAKYVKGGEDGTLEGDDDDDDW